MIDNLAGWEHFDHEADIGVRGFGPTVADAFAQAAMAMTAVICDLQSVHATRSVKIDCTASDLEVLFVDWLNSLVYEMATRRMLFSRFDVVISNTTLRAVVWGEDIDVKRHQPAVEVKGATYTALQVSHDESGLWMAQTVVDV